MEAAAVWIFCDLSERLGNLNMNSNLNPNPNPGFKSFLAKIEKEEEERHAAAEAASKAIIEKSPGLKSPSTPALIQGSPFSVAQTPRTSIIVNASPDAAESPSHITKPPTSTGSSKSVSSGLCVII